MQRPLVILSSILLSAVAVSATPFNALITPRAVAQIPGYDAAGCYTEATGMRALTGFAFYDDAMTAEKCATACQGFKYFGLEYGRECYCGNTFNPGSEEAKIEDCKFTCPGNTAQNCGAGNRLTLYIRSENPAAVDPTMYSSLGCFTEGTNSRTLTGKASASGDMTVQKCADICSGAGFPLFGLEYYHECYCGNSLSGGAVEAPSYECRYNCVGNSKERCGGDWRLNVYQFGVASPTSSSSTSSLSTSPTAAPATYSSEGCYTEIKTGRALSGLSYYDDTMTVAKCATACSAFTWFGVEYGRECFCGNTLDKGSLQTDISECNFPCPGKSSETCGAGNRLNLYRNGPAQVASSSSTTTTSATTTTTLTTISTTASTTASTTTSTTTTTTTPITTSTTTSSTTSSTEVPSSSSSTTTSVVSSTESSSSTSSTTTSSTTTSTTTTPSPTPSSTTSSTTTSLTTTTTTTESTTTTTTTTSTTTTTTTTTTSTAPACATPVLNPGFEGVDGSPWVARLPNAGFSTYNFMSSSVPHSGSQSGTVTNRQNPTQYPTWFNQPITVCPNTLYNFSAYIRAFPANPGCTVRFYIGSPDDTVVKKIMTSTSSPSVTGNWIQIFGTYQSDGDTQLAFNIRLTSCASASTGGKVYYFDDISFVAAA